MEVYMSQIFVSYSRQDRNVVSRLIEAIRRDGHQILIHQDIPGGQHWREKIVKSIRTADVFLVFLSPRSIASDEVRAELDIAADERKSIVPAIIEHVSIPDKMAYPLAGKNRIDLTTTDAQPLRSAIQALTKETTALSATIPFHWPKRRSSGWIEAFLKVSPNAQMRPLRNV